MLEREIRSSWGATLAWFGRPSWGQVAAKLLGSRPKSALVSGLDSVAGSELPCATPVDQIEPGSIQFGAQKLFRLIREFNVDICINRKGFTLCRQPPTGNLRPVERVDFEILVILLRRLPEILLLEPKCAPQHLGEIRWYQHDAKMTQHDPNMTPT